MKWLCSLLAIMGLTVLAQAQTPASPTLAVPSYAGSDILTNVAVTLPVGTFQQGVVYAPARTLTNISVQLTWNANTEPNLAGYRMLFGDAKLGTQTTLEVPKNVTNVVMFTLNTNIAYFFYVKAFNLTNAESGPSTVVLYQPSK